MRIKLPRQNTQAKINRTVYASDECNLEYAHESVNQTITDHFYRKADKGYKEAIARDKKMNTIQANLNRG